MKRIICFFILHEWTYNRTAVPGKKIVYTKHCSCCSKVKKIKASQYY